jgi:hypothetical protein
MVRRDFSRAVPETFAMVDGHIATKRIIFLVQNLKRVGRDFTPSVPETFADGRWSDGRRARGWSRLTWRSRTEDRETLRDGRWSEWRVGVGSGLALTSIDDARCRPARVVGLPILGTVALATARPRGGTAAITHAAGRLSRSPRPVRRVLGGITGRAVDGPRARKGGVAGASGGCGVAAWSRSARQSGRRRQRAGRSNGG